MQRTSYISRNWVVAAHTGISSTLALTAALVLPVAFARATTETNQSPGSVRERIERIIQSAPVTNLEELEFYKRGQPFNVRPDVVRLTYFNSGSSGSEHLLGQVFNLPTQNRFYIAWDTDLMNGPRHYYGPFEGDPFRVLGAQSSDDPARNGTRSKSRSLTNPASGEPDNPLGLDDDTIIRFFKAGKAMQTVALFAGQWAASHHLRVPDTVEEMYAQYINRDELGKDPFTEGKLRVEAVPGKIRVYSAGPDGEWDGGKLINSADPDLKGDVGVEVEVGKNNIQWLNDGAVGDYLHGKHTARYLAKRGKHYPVQFPLPEWSGEALKFGSNVDGLRAAVELVPTNGAFVQGQPIEVRFHIRNEADYEIQIAGSEWREGDTLILEDEKGEPVKNQWGRPIMTMRSYTSGWSGTKRAVLKPGQVTVFKSSGLAFADRGVATRHPVGYSADLKPGRYSVRFKLLFPFWNAQLMDWQGQLETGPAHVELIAANSPTDEAKGTALAATKESDHSAYFSGQVVDDETGKPIKEFQVQLGSATPQKPEEITWRPEFNSATLPYRGNNYENQGRFGAETHQTYNHGKAWARVLADGYLPQTVTPEPVVSPSRVENLVVRLKKGRELRGAVLDSVGRPAAGARVFLAGTRGVSEAQQQLWFKSTIAITDADGRFTLQGVGAPGQQVTVFSSAGLEAEPAPIPEPGQELKIILP